MLKELQQLKEYYYEDINSFNKSDYPCFYIKKEFGYTVFFITSDDCIDYAIYDLNKKLISLVQNINSIIKDETNWTTRFLIDNTSKDKKYIQYLKENNPSNYNYIKC